MDREFDSLLARLAANVVRLRKAKKLTQEQLAHDASADRSYVSGIETGKSNPSLMMVHKLAIAVDATVVELLSEPSASTVSAVTPDDTLR